jgi:hypothetical protein
MSNIKLVDGAVVFTQFRLDYKNMRQRNCWPTNEIIYYIKGAIDAMWLANNITAEERDDALAHASGEIAKW